MSLYIKSGENRPARGSILRFGSYPFIDHDDDHTPVEWLVLHADPHSLLLLSRYALDTLPDGAAMPGERLSTAAVRWMNSVMLERMFGPNERKALLPGSPDTLFLLTEHDVKAYADSCEECRAPVTEYAAAHGAYAAEEKAENGQPYGRWLLDGEDGQDWMTLFIEETGTLTKSNRSVGRLALRPAVRIDRDKAHYREGPNDPAEKYRHVLRIDHFF